MSKTKMATFQKVKLGDVIEIYNGKAVKAEPSGAFPVYGSNGKIGFSPISSYTDAVILGRVGAYCGSVMIEKDKFWASDNTIVLKNNRNTDLGFLYYLLKHLNLNQYAGGAAQPLITHTILKQINISMPDLPTQTRIASVLSAYDDLIENNEKRIKTLEEMAQLLYTKWFVKFKFPGHEKVKMVDSELGIIPDIFSIEDVTNLVQFVRGVEPGSANYRTIPGPGLIPFLRVGDLGSRNSELFIKELDAKGKITERKDILVTMDGTVGRVVMGMSGAYSTGIRKLVIKDRRINREFLFCFMSSDYIRDIINAHAKGSTILHASESIEYMKVILPTGELMSEFERLVKPIIDQILNLQDSNRILSQTRDLLIPQLVTGKRELK